MKVKEHKNKRIQGYRISDKPSAPIAKWFQTLPITVFTASLYFQKRRETTNLKATDKKNG